MGEAERSQVADAPTRDHFALHGDDSDVAIAYQYPHTAFHFQLHPSLPSHFRLEVSAHCGWENVGKKNKL